jgi:hypothetical protein
MQTIENAATELIRYLLGHGYCPNCGCDKWNTLGCRICPLMRRGYDLLVMLGEREPRTFADYAEPDEINLRNMEHAKFVEIVKEEK